MRAVVQRVSEASVAVEGETVAAIGRGFLVLLGVAGDDSEADAEWMAEKIVNLRVFEDDEGKLNRSLQESGGELLVVSQFTLLGDCRKGRRPSFSGAAGPEQARELYLKFARGVEERGVSVRTGRFQAMMDVALVNRGPVTLLLDSKKTF
ncbi:MAG TPA: D-aminoacyl-tRNA deacylase [bacterium]|nr:D-aminoacyl-tRNA deacylase [bacterium]